MRQSDKIDNRIIVVMRWRYWRLKELGMAHTDADKRWELFDLQARFPASAGICDQSPILDWLHSQGSCVS
jgi:hypothetical protein